MTLERRRERRGAQLVVRLQPPRRLEPAVLVAVEAALQQRQFRVVYQPLFDPATGRLVGVEALA